MTQALMIRDDALQKVTWSEQAQQYKDMALAAAALIGKVHDAMSNEEATRALESLHRLTTEVEKDRVTIKQPLVAFGRLIDHTAREFCQEVNDEKTRLGAALGDYAELLRLRAAAEQQAANERLTELEKARASEVAQALTVEQADRINEKYAEAARTMEQPAPPPKPSGQVIKEDWSISVTDIWLLARSHPTCVKIEPSLSEIKALLNAGVQVKGVRAERVTKASVRLKPQPQAIEV